MRKLFFDEAFDGGVFNGRHGLATAGESWVGPLGALGSLESLLGLTHKALGAGVRVGEALRGLSETSGFWDKSLEADGLATAREMLRWSDTLKLHGWKGQGTGRLEVLAKALSRVKPGPAERLERVKERLALIADVRYEVGLYAAIESLPRLWREVLSAAASQVNFHELPTAFTTEELMPEVDEREIQLIRPYGPLMAADSIAAALAASKGIATVIIGSDPVLDAALRRHGLPTTGAAQTPHDNVLGEMLPLIIELGLSPADPQRALELLTIQQSPIRPKVAYRLRRALQQWPAVNSPEWKKALEKVLPELEGDKERQIAKDRVRWVFGGKVSDARRYPTPVLLERATEMIQWLQGRIANETFEETIARLQAVVGQAMVFKNLVDFASASELTMTQVRRFLEEAHRGMATPSAFPHQAGFHVVSRPGGVVAPVERIVWWNYTRSSSSSPRPLGLSGSELEALKALNVVLPTTAELARQRATRARRPFVMKTQSLWLISPKHEVNGDEATPHPSWDEISARVSDSKLVSRMVRPEPLLETPVKKTKRVALALPSAVLEWKADAVLPRREQESPSSVETMLACSLKWALTYIANLRSGATATLPTGDQLLGKLAHFVLLERTLKVPHASGSAAADYAIEILETEGPALAAPLFLAGASAERGQVEKVLRSAAEALHKVVSTGWKVAETEHPLEGTAFGTKFGGNLDLIVERSGKRAVIDLKWSGHKYRRESLEDGTALQLAAYAALLAEQGFADAPVAYFILTSQAMLSSDVTLALEGTALKSQWSADLTWKLLQKSHDEAWESVSKGRLVAPGVVDDKHQPKTTITEDKALTMQPPCRYCEFDGVCGRRYGQLEAPDVEN